MKTFTFPATPKCRVVYVRGGVRYEGVMTTPTTQLELIRGMSARSATVNDIKSIEPVQPPKDWVMPSPAAHKAAVYATAAEH